MDLTISDVFVALLVLAVIYLRHRIDKLESRVALTEAGHKTVTLIHLVKALASTETEDMVTFIAERGWLPEERASLAVTVLEGLRDSSLEVTPEVRRQLADAVAELLRCRMLNRTTRTRLIRAVEGMANATPDVAS